MDIELYRDYCLSKKCVTESFPFSKLPDVIVFKVSDKMFTETNILTFNKISVKCSPDLIDDLKEKYGSVGKPAYFNEKHWIAVTIDGSIPDAKLFEWIDNSYNLVVSKLPKSIKQKYGL